MDVVPLLRTEKAFEVDSADSEYKTTLAVNHDFTMMHAGILALFWYTIPQFLSHAEQ